MTTEEAIEIFEHNWTRLVNPDYTEEELNDALNMAIKCLNQLTGHWVEVKKACANCQEFDCDGCEYKHWREVTE